MKTKDELIAEIRAGKLAIENDVEPDQLNEILKAAFTEADTAGGDSDYYYTDGSGMNWTSSDRPKVETTLPTIKATDLLAMMEEKELAKAMSELGKKTIAPILDAIHSDTEESSSTIYSHPIYGTSVGIGSNNRDEPVSSDTQSKLWRELIDIYDVTDRSSEGYGSLIKVLSKQFTIQRNPSLGPNQ